MDPCGSRGFFAVVRISVTSADLSGVRGQLGARRPGLAGLAARRQPGQGSRAGVGRESGERPQNPG